MTYRTTVGWSLFSSGLVTLVLGFLPGDDLFWGVLLVALGLAVLFVRQT
ncbi:hypothetical protein [Haloarchaeobius sp. HRN-SO-5]